ncbi:hypothetical protein D3C81_1189110 [compost metagenome]
MLRNVVGEEGRWDADMDVHQASLKRKRRLRVRYVPPEHRRNELALGFDVALEFVFQHFRQAGVLRIDGKEEFFKRSWME